MFVILASGACGGINPVMTARLMTVASERMKSSAVSVSVGFAEPACCDRAPSLPSGLPVLNEKTAAQTGVVRHIASIAMTAMYVFFSLISSRYRREIVLHPITARLRFVDTDLA